MELKDVIHFYIGSNAIIGKKSQNDGGGDLIGKIVGYDTKAQGTVICIYYDHGVQKGCIVPTSIKLILRPLSSMTEADCPDWFKTWMPNGFDVHWQISNSNGYIEVDSRADDGYLLTISQDGSMNCECKDNGEQYEYRGAELFAHLLSRGFDLFGLIKSGKAIDATSLTQPLK